MNSWDCYTSGIVNQSSMTDFLDTLLDIFMNFFCVQTLNFSFEENLFAFVSIERSTLAFFP